MELASEPIAHFSFGVDSVEGVIPLRFSHQLGLAVGRPNAADVVVVPATADTKESLFLRRRECRSQQRCEDRDR